MKLALKLSIIAGALLVGAAPASATIVPASAGAPEMVRTALYLSMLAFLPAIVICMTSFVRTVIVLAMVRHAFGMPETPPNAVLISLSLFLTAFTMSPVISRINQQAYQPYMAGTDRHREALAQGGAPLRDFMLAQTSDSDIESIYAISKTPVPDDPRQGRSSEAGAGVPPQ